MPKMEQIELAAHRNQIIADVNALVDKYRAIFDWDIPEIDQRTADRLIVQEISLALDHIQQQLLD